MQMFRSDMNSKTCPEQIQNGMRLGNIVGFERRVKSVEQVSDLGMIVHQPLVSFCVHLALPESRRLVLDVFLAPEMFPCSGDVPCSEMFLARRCSLLGDV